MSKPKRDKSSSYLAPDDTGIISMEPSLAVCMSEWSLVFSEPGLEHAFRVNQRRLWSSAELWRVQMNFLAGTMILIIIGYTMRVRRVSKVAQWHSKQRHLQVEGALFCLVGQRLNIADS
jgi:hypothetical protein